jgi:hypothetical protein
VHCIQAKALGQGVEVGRTQKVSAQLGTVQNHAYAALEGPSIENYQDPPHMREAEYQTDTDAAVLLCGASTHPLFLT